MEKLYAFPKGFRMVAGDPFARNHDGSLAAEAVSFACVDSNTAQSNGIANTPCPDGLRAQIFFPKCWDGKNIDSADHRSHMSYPDGDLYDNGDCPPSHPFHTVSMFFEVFYDTARFNDEWVNDTHPFVFSQGDATGYGFHGDFFNGWDVDVLQTAIDTCTDEFGVVEKCPVFTLFTNDECKNCKLPTSVQERVDGRLASLPGCNPITYGPERATVDNCSGETALFGDSPQNYVDLTQKQKWEYVGCGTDSVSDRAMSGKMIRNNHMTVDMCVYYCNFFGYTYAALENGNECFCNTELNMKHAPKQGFMGSCSKPCPGNSRQVCGGVNAMSIYHRCTRTSCKNKVFSIVASVDSQEADLQLNTTYFDLGVAAANGNYDCFCNAFTLPPPTPS